MHLTVNGETITSTPGHKYYAPEKGWTSAIELEKGDLLQLVNGEYVVVEAVQYEILEKPVNIYNFEVEDFHTYYVGEQSVLVHNRDCLKSALQKLEESGIRPGQESISRSQLNDVLEKIKNGYNPRKAESFVYFDGTNRYLVEGHHTEVAFAMLGKEPSFNMRQPTTMLPSMTTVHWTKKWYEFWKKTIKIID